MRKSFEDIAGTFAAAVIVVLCAISNANAHIKCPVNTGFGTTNDLCPVHNHVDHFPPQRAWRWKTGNNNSVSCNTFCSDPQWGGFSGVCVKGFDNNRQTEISCRGGFSGLSNVKCLCRIDP
jgi:hypothetical protein